MALRCLNKVFDVECSAQLCPHTLDRGFDRCRAMSDATSVHHDAFILFEVRVCVCVCMCVCALEYRTML